MRSLCLTGALMPGAVVRVGTGFVASFVRVIGCWPVCARTRCGCGHLDARKRCLHRRRRARRRAAGRCRDRLRTTGSGQLRAHLLAAPRDRWIGAAREGRIDRLRRQARIGGRREHDEVLVRAVDRRHRAVARQWRRDVVELGASSSVSRFGALMLLRDVGHVVEHDGTRRRSSSPPLPQTTSTASSSSRLRGGRGVLCMTGFDVSTDITTDVSLLP